MCIRDSSKSLNIFRETAEELSKGKIIGWFQGAAEFGPRALGNRSILCKPYPAEMKDYLNNQVKFRESFRPFAPAILSEYQRDFFEINQDSFHMLIASKVKEDKNIYPTDINKISSLYLKTEDELFDRMMKCFLIGAVNRAMNNGCKFVTCLSLKGKQGLQKSSFFKTIVSAVINK